MSFKDFIAKPIEMSFERHDSLGGKVQHLMGWLHLDAQGENLVTFTFRKTHDHVLDHMEGWGEYLTDPDGRFPEYLHLYGFNKKFEVRMDGIFYPLETNGMSGFHLHANYGYRQLELLNLLNVPKAEPIGHDEEPHDRPEITVSDRKFPHILVRQHFKFKRPVTQKMHGGETHSGGGSEILGSSWEGH